LTDICAMVLYRCAVLRRGEGDVATERSCVARPGYL